MTRACVAGVALAAMLACGGEEAAPFQSRGDASSSPPEQQRDDCAVDLLEEMFAEFIDIRVSAGPWTGAVGDIDGGRDIQGAVNLRFALRAEGSGCLSDRYITLLFKTLRDGEHTVAQPEGVELNVAGQVTLEGVDFEAAAVIDIWEEGRSEGGRWATSGRMTFSRLAYEDRLWSILGDIDLTFDGPDGPLRVAATIRRN